MAWCLTEPNVRKFKDLLVSGRISPDKLNSMNSQQRRDLFSEHFGENNAKNINQLFESKLLLKNVQKGMISWANTVMKGDAEVKRDIISRIRKLDERILDPKTQDQFLEDLAAKKLGLDITFDQAKKITELSKKIEDAAVKDLSVEKNRIEYGEQILNLEEYLQEIAGRKMSLAENIVNVLNIPRTIMTTVDLSAPLRQGWGMLSRKQFYSSFVDMFKAAASESEFKKIRADIITRPTFRQMKKGKLRITNLSDKIAEREEAYMTNLLDKVPFIRGSSRAYLGFLNKLRADVFDDLYSKAQMQGLIGIDSVQDERMIHDIAEVVNNFTGAGNLGKNDRFAGAVPLLNNLLFSPRKTVATINKFRPDTYIRLTPFARKEALRQLVGSIGITATIISLAVAMGADWQEDPTSSDFGKIILGNTRIDMTGGEGSFLVFLSRFYSQKVKSSTTGLSRSLNDGWGTKTRADITIKWIRNKLSPVASFFYDWAEDSNAIGEKFTFPKAIKDRMIPILISDFIELASNDPQNTFLAMIFNIFGASAQSYTIGENWQNFDSKELESLKKEIGETGFKDANTMFNELYKESYLKIKDNEEYLNLDDKAQIETIQGIKKRLKKQVFREFGFRPRKERKESEEIESDFTVKRLIRENLR